MKLQRLRDFTPARVAIGRAGDSLPTSELLAFQLAHAQARDAVHAQLDSASLALELQQHGFQSILVASAAPDRATYLRRPDLGRILNAESRHRLAGICQETALIVADGLSALAVRRHAVPLLLALPRPAGPVVIVEQGRVAIGDQIGELMRASLSVILIGERPGLSSPDSLGVYVTWQPKPGRTDADRSCISNIRTEGLSYADAAETLRMRMHASLGAPS